MNEEHREFHNVLNEESSSSSEGSYFIDINPLYKNPVQPIPDHPNDFNNWMNDAIMVEDVNIVNQEDVHAYGSSESDHAQNSSLSSLSKIKRKHRYKRYSYDEIVESLVVHYGDSKHVNEMDIIMLYIVGQKHLYTQAARITNSKLYSLYGIAITMTVLGTIMAPLLSSYWWNYIAISTCNGIATGVLSLMNYLKLDQNVGKYKYIANHYESFENCLEIASTKISHLASETEKNTFMLDTLRITEIRINESRELNQTLIPSELKDMFPVITHIHIFSFIKKMRDHKQMLIRQFRDQKNNLSRMVYHYENPSSIHHSSTSQEAIHKLNVEIEEYRNQIIKYNKAYTELEKLIYREIRHVEKHQNHIWCLLPQPTYLNPSKYTNEVIVEYLQMLIE